MTSSSVLIRLDWFCKQSIFFYSLSYLWKLTNSKNSILPRKFKYLTKKWNAIFLRFSNPVHQHIFFQCFILNKNLIYLQQKTSIRPQKEGFFVLAFFIFFWFFLEWWYSVTQWYWCFEVAAPNWVESLVLWCGWVEFIVGIIGKHDKVGDSLSIIIITSNFSKLETGKKYS